MSMRFQKVYQACGHTTKTVKWISDSPNTEDEPDQLIRVNSDDIATPSFCPNCYASRDRFKNGWSFRRNGMLVYGKSQHLEAQTILQRAEALVLTETSTPYGLVWSSLPKGTILYQGEVPDVPYLGYSMTGHINLLCESLKVSFWWLLTEENTAPTQQHRDMIVLLETYSNFSLYSQIARYTYRPLLSPEERLQKLDSLLTIVPLNSLDGEEQICTICCKHFDENESEGSDDSNQDENINGRKHEFASNEELQPGPFGGTNPSQQYEAEHPERRAYQSDYENEDVVMEDVLDYEPQLNENPIKTTCGVGQHLFGETCLREWLEDNDSCPVCRHPILPLKIQASREDFHTQEEEEGSKCAIPGWLSTLLGYNE